MSDTSSQSSNYFKFLEANVYHLGTCNSNFVKIFFISVLFAMGIGSWHLILGSYDFVPGSFLWTKDFRDHVGGYWWSNVLNWIFLNVTAGVYYFIALETMQQFMMQGYNPLGRQAPPPKINVGTDVTNISNTTHQTSFPTQFDTNDSVAGVTPSSNAKSSSTFTVSEKKEQVTPVGSPLRQHLPTGVTPVELSPEEEQEIAAQRALHRAQFAEQELIDKQYQKQAHQYILQLREQLVSTGVVTGFLCGFSATTIALARVMISLVWFFLISYLVENIYLVQKPWSGFFFITKQPVFDGTAELLTHYNNALFNGCFWLIMFLFICHTFAFANLYVWKTLEQLISKVGIFSLIATLVMLVVMRVLGAQVLQFIYESEVRYGLEEPEVLNYTFNWILNWVDMVVVASCMSPFFITKVFNPAVQLDDQHAASTAEEINQQNH